MPSPCKATSQDIQMKKETSRKDESPVHCGGTEMGSEHRFPNFQNFSKPHALVPLFLARMTTEPLLSNEFVTEE